MTWTKKMAGRRQRDGQTPEIFGRWHWQRQWLMGSGDNSEGWWCYWLLGPDNSLLSQWGRPVHCRRFSSISGLCPLDAISSHSHDNQNWLQTLTNVPLGAKSPWVENHQIREVVPWPHGWLVSGMDTWHIIHIEEMAKEVFWEFLGNVSVLPKERHKLGWLFLVWMSLGVHVRPGSAAAVLYPAVWCGSVGLGPLDGVTSDHCATARVPVTWAPCLLLNLTQFEWDFLLLATKEV